MTDTLLVLPYTVNDISYGLPLTVVDQVAPVVEITPAAGWRHEILGIINVHGEIMAVVSMRRVFGAPDRPLQLSDRLIFVRTPAGRRALLVDAVGEAIEITTESESPRAYSDSPPKVAVMPEGILQVHDVPDLSADTALEYRQTAQVGGGLF